MCVLSFSLVFLRAIHVGGSKGQRPASTRERMYVVERTFYINMSTCFRYCKLLGLSTDFLSHCNKEDYAGNGVISCHDVIRKTMLVMG